MGATLLMGVGKVPLQEPVLNTDPGKRSGLHPTAAATAHACYLFNTVSEFL